MGQHNAALTERAHKRETPGKHLSLPGVMIQTTRRLERFGIIRNAWKRNALSALSAECCRADSQARKQVKYSTTENQRNYFAQSANFVLRYL